MLSMSSTPEVTQRKVALLEDISYCILAALTELTSTKCGVYSKIVPGIGPNIVKYVNSL